MFLYVFLWILHPPTMRQKSSHDQTTKRFKLASFVQWNNVENEWGEGQFQRWLNRGEGIEIKMKETTREREQIWNYLIQQKDLAAFRAKMFPDEKHHRLNINSGRFPWTILCNSASTKWGIAVHLQSKFLWTRGVSPQSLIAPFKFQIPKVCSNKRYITKTFDGYCQTLITAKSSATEISSPETNKWIVHLKWGDLTINSEISMHCITASYSSHT